MVSHLYRISTIIVKYFLLLYAVVGESGNYQDNSTTAIRMTPDFTVIYKSSGLKVYKRKTLDNKLEFVTVVNTNKAKVKHLTGNLSKSNHNKIYKKSLTEFWQDEKKIDDNAQQLKVITNGTYFSTKNNPTGVAFGLKIPGRRPIYGYGVSKEYIGQIRTLSWNNKTAVSFIQTYMVQTFRISQNVVGGLDITANKSAREYLPRTFVGVMDQDNDGLTETIVFYSGNYTRQIDASTTLKHFGVKSSMMLDGGGSTGLILEGQSLIHTNRTLPHALAIYSITNQ